MKFDEEQEFDGLSNVEGDEAQVRNILKNMITFFVSVPHS